MTFFEQRAQHWQTTSQRLRLGLKPSFFINFKARIVLGDPEPYLQSCCCGSGGPTMFHWAPFPAQLSLFFKYVCQYRFYLLSKYPWAHLVVFVVFVVVSFLSSHHLQPVEADGCP